MDSVNPESIEFSCVLIVPCYNEAARLDVADWHRFAQAGVADVCFVNDGSKDDTLAVLESMASQYSGRVTVLSLSQNSGKAEAVRHGMLHALEQGYQWIGYADADLATPVEELWRLISIAREHSHLHAIFGSRIARAGARIERKPLRHYLGRFFATAAATVLDAAIYDTQCGAKFFRETEQLRDALATPFLTRWLFDVELLGRLMAGTPTRPPVSIDKMLEVPLEVWQDVRGSKVSAATFLLAAFAMIRVAKDLRERRAARRAK
jgi:glycosyltransferase involved in cell wall biosynthesis